MAADGSIIIDTQIDTRGFRNGEANIRSAMSRLGSAASKLGTILAGAFAIKGITNFAREAIELGSDLQEVQNVVDVTFTTMSDKVNEFAKNAAVSAGLSETMAKQYVGTFGAMAKAFGFTEAEAYNMSTELTQLSGDVASFYNISQDEAYYKLKSVFTGETETLKDLGIVMTQSTLDAYAMANGFGKATSAMTEQEKVALRLQFVTEQLSLASGDFIRTSDGWANQVRILKLQIDSLKATIGQGLINLFTPIIKAVNVVLGKIATLANAFKAFTELITGKKASGGNKTGMSDKGIESAAAGYNDAADAANNLGAANNNAASGAKKAAGATKKAADATKKAKKESEGYLSSIDEINKMTKKQEEASSGAGAGGGGTGGGGGGGGGGAGGMAGAVEDVDYGNLAEGENVLDDLGNAFDKIIEKIKELAGLFVQGFWDGLGDYKPALEDIKNDIASIGQSLKEIFTDPGVVAAADNFAKQLAYSLGQVAGSVASIGLTIARNIIGGIEKYLSQNVERIKKYIIDMFNISSDIAEIIGNFSVALADIFSVFGSETAQQITANLIGIFSEIGMMVSETAAKLGRDILNMITLPIIENKDKIKTAIEGTLQAIEPFTSGLLTAVQAVRDAVSKIYDDHLKPLFDSIAKGLSTILGKLLDGYNQYVVPVLKALGERFKEIMEGPFGDTVDKIANFIGKLIDALRLLWENILVPLFSWIAQNIMPILAKIIQFIGEKLLNKLETVIKVVGDIADVLSGLIDFVVGIFTGDWEKAWEGVKEVVSGVWNAIKDIVEGKWNELKSIVKTGVDIVKNVVKAAWDGLKALTSTVWNAIKTIVLGIWTGLKTNAGKMFNDIKTAISTVWNTIKSATSTVWNAIKSTVSGIWNGLKTAASTVFNAIKTAISTAWNAIKSVTSTVWNAVKTAVTTVWNTLKTKASSIFNGIKTAISNVWTAIKGTTANVWKSVIMKINSMWRNLKENASNVFGKIKSVITNAWNGIKTATTNIWNGIKNAVKSPINAIIGFMNRWLRGMANIINGLSGMLNNLKFDIPDWVPGVGGNSLGFNIPKVSAPQIPYLATGAVIPPNAPFMAMLGDQRNGNNLEMPESLMRKIVREESGNGQKGGQYRFTAQINRRTLFDEMITEAKLRQGQNGRNPFELA